MDDFEGTVHTTGSDEPRRLSADRLALLKQRLAADGASPAVVPRQRSAGEQIPLSFAQERLWFLNRILAGSPMYDINVALRIRGPLRVDVLEHAVTALVQRHRVLRSSFPATDDGPRQVVAPAEPLTIPMEDLAGYPSERREQAVIEASEALLAEPLDLDVAPMRTALVKADEDDHVLLVKVHHIAFDATSYEVLRAELGALYEAYAADETVLPSAPTLQYADYAVWQREEAASGRYAEQLDYWRSRLSGDVPLLELPVDLLLPTEPRYTGGSVSCSLTPKLSEGIRALGAAERTTLYSTMLTVFGAVLARHVDSDEVIVGIPASTRQQPELEEVVGVFLNMLVGRLDFAGEPTFREALRRTHDTALEAYANQDVPFERLVEVLQPERSLSRTPFIDAVLNIAPASAEQQFADLSVTPMMLGRLYAGYPLTLYVNQHQESIQLELVYQDERFTSERMTELLNQIEFLLEQVVEDPDQSLWSYSLVTPAARALLRDPAEPLERPERLSVVTTVEERAHVVPDHVAVRYRGREWKYWELAESVRAIARQLRGNGLSEGDVVGIVGEPSFGYITAFLGVMRARGVALPMDRMVPEARQRVMLDVGQATRLLLVGDGGAAESWVPGCDVPVFRVAGDTGVLDAEPALHVALPDPHPEDPAYLYFTSGTTGTPKAILGRNDVLDHLITWQRETFRVGPGDRCGLTTRLLFDMVLRDIFLPLTSGGTVCIPDDEMVSLDATAVLRWLADEQVTLLHVVPSLARRWVSNVPEGVALTSMRWVYFAGEPLTEELVRRWRDRIRPGGTVINFYGTTETMVRTYHQVPKEPIPGVQSVGRELPDTQILVINRDRQPCGIGEVGEVLLRSRVITYGYTNAPEEMAARFLPNWFRDDDPDDVLFLTGDNGRYRPDGTLEVLGRTDDQLKVHGVRVEPVGIQAVLNVHPDVVAAAVIAVDDGDAEPALGAYVVPATNDLVVADLQRYLRERLPEPMVPHRWAFLPELPMLPNGKVDKNSLPPAHTAFRGDRSEGITPPEGEVELALAEIWVDLLGVPQVDRKANFFELGGHSLKVVDLVTRIRDVLKVDIPLRVVFEEPTLHSLAMAIEHGREMPESDSQLDAVIAALEELEDED
ncbi:MAG: condensation domain-containing protein [Nocardioides sp.]|uniref:non-ribosomal peptide synthetase n=1 Tax=Nocardioides sp. TaxID=35761 RepID=UPI0039E5C962